MLQRKDAETRVRPAARCSRPYYDAGRKGIAMQRYKGLGEMNPEQLWETTLDSDARTLLQVKIERPSARPTRSSPRLMGDVVEPRRDCSRGRIA